MTSFRVCGLRILAITSLTVSSFVTAPADELSDFYSGNRVTIIVPTSAGGGYDLPARVLARHIGRHIPGNPTIVVQNMPGAGGKRAINHVHNAAPRDGTIISAAHSFIAFDPLFEGTATKAKFDPKAFNWLGSVMKTTSVGVAWHTSGVASHQDLYSKDLVVGGVGVSTPMVTHPNLLRGLLGMRFKVVVGYLSGSEVDLAMERGEVQGRIDYTWFGLKEGRPDWLKDKKINILFQMGLSKAHDLPDVPLALDFARNDEDRRILETVFLSYEFGRPFITTPVLPADRLRALRTAFMATMSDPEFKTEAVRSKLEVNPVQPERLSELVDRAYQMPASLIARINALQNPPGNVTKVTFKTVRAKLGEPLKKGRRTISLLGDGRQETIIIHPSQTKVSISGNEASASDLKPGATCAISYLGDKTTAAAVSCD